MQTGQYQERRSANSAAADWRAASRGAAPDNEMMPSRRRMGEGRHETSRGNRGEGSRASSRDESRRSLAKAESDRSAGRALGWVSLAIGVTELCCPGKIARLMGVEGAESEGILRVCGLREIGQGIDILVHDNPTPGVWARAAGDVLDGLLLGIAGTNTQKPAGFFSVCAAVLPVVIADMVVAPRLSRQQP